MKIRVDEIGKIKMKNDFEKILTLAAFKSLTSFLGLENIEGSFGIFSYLLSNLL